MATPLGWSKAGSGSVCLAFDQLRDVIESQEELIHQLRNVMVLQDENFVSKEEFQAVEKKLVEEKAAHAKTKVLLAKEEEKLQFALGEVEVLSKQLEKEKLAFEKAVKSKVLQESSKKDQLITKCNEIESHIIKQEDILNGKENEIKELQQVISQQKQIFSPPPAGSIAGITCLTSGSRSSRRATWPRCWTRSIRKPQGRVRPTATSIPGKNKMAAAFLFSGCNPQPLPSLLWESPASRPCYFPPFWVVVAVHKVGACSLREELGLCCLVGTTASFGYLIPSYINSPGYPVTSHPTPSVLVNLTLPT
ncbi:spermatogenesis-associated protein 24 isoform X2 [Macaca thibetana thibetana]|uniref:spermatogenesis-associated protein 24 isoform X2 n=1 Tax=Macaca thibetana thibetana TaxID=257877 RepID=UPI0021BCCECD|nr:spermatogenesis-associated protein 24 isoform X2 [Macaca thibetana thibetana]